MLSHSPRSTRRSRPNRGHGWGRAAENAGKRHAGSTYTKFVCRSVPRVAYVPTGTPEYCSFGGKWLTHPVYEPNVSKLFRRKRNIRTTVVSFFFLLVFSFFAMSRFYFSSFWRSCGLRCRPFSPPPSRYIHTCLYRFYRP